MFDTEVPFDLLDPETPRPEPVTDPLVEDLDWLPTGIMLAAALNGIDRASLSGHDRVSVLQGRARLRAQLDAEVLADMNAILEEMIVRAETDPSISWDPYEMASSEIGTALNLTRRGADFQLGLAHQLCQRLPSVWEALHEGRIDLHRARIFADQTSHLPEELAGKVCSKALERASDQTTGQLRARIQRLIISLDPAAAKDRYGRKLTERMVVCEPTDAGTANIHGLDLPAEEANQAMGRINQYAQVAKRCGDRRGIDQIRADVFLDLLTGNHQKWERSGSQHGVVDIRVDLTTLLDLDDKPGEIPGWGPVLADVTRQLVGDADKAEWRTAIYNEDRLIDVITTKRRPTAAQKRAVETRNPTCVFPGCRMPSRECDLDHRHTWAETHETSTCGLEPLCRHHHKLKHRGWKVEKHPSKPGYYIWTSPLGHTYTTGPDP
jgi:hypothetical protein